MSYAEETCSADDSCLVKDIYDNNQHVKSIPLVSFDTSTRYSFRQRVSKYTSGIDPTDWFEIAKRVLEQESSAELVSPVPILSFMGTQSMVFGQDPRVYLGGQQDEMIPMPIMTLT